MPTTSVDRTTPQRVRGGSHYGVGESPVHARRSLALQVLAYAWGMLAHPRATMDALAAEHSVRLAIVLASLGVLEAWVNNLLFAAFGFDYLGSRPLLSDPTFVGGMGYLRISPDQFRLLFPGFIMLTALYGLLVPTATAQLLSKLWHGRGTFEQMVNILVFATTPSLVIAWLSEWLTGVPLNLLTGSAYFYGDAMQGKFRPAVASLWTAYSIAIYVVPWTWSFVLGVIGIHRVQRVPYWAATVIHFCGFGLNMLLISTFIR
jgi:Yip1 domain